MRRENPLIEKRIGLSDIMFLALVLIVLVWLAGTCMDEEEGEVAPRETITIGGSLVIGEKE